MKHVCYFRHALALDERRVKFLPEYAYGHTTVKGKDTSAVKHQPPPQDDNPPSENAESQIVKNELSEAIPPIDNKAKYGYSRARMKSTETHPHTMEVWFAGTHSDM